MIALFLDILVKATALLAVAAAVDAALARLASSATRHFSRRLSNASWSCSRDRLDSSRRRRSSSRFSGSGFFAIVSSEKFAYEPNDVFVDRHQLRNDAIHDFAVEYRLFTSPHDAMMAASRDKR